jgi:hypothetical protein
MRKILILSANPLSTDRLRLDEEVREIQSALERARSREEFELITRWAVRIDDLRRALLDEEPQIVHFSGHGTGTDGIAVENSSGQVQLVSTESLTNLFELFKNKVECVLLNACYSEAQAEAIYQHIDCVIGMKNSIQDYAAINFSKGLYDAICAGRNYEEAFKFGCNSIDLSGIPQSLIPAIKIRDNSAKISANNQPLTKPKEQKNDMADNHDIKMGDNSIYNEKIHGHFVKGNYYAGGEQQSLAETAKEIQQLLEQLDKSYPTNTTMGKMVVATEAIKQIDSDPTLSRRIFSAMKAGGTQAFEQFLNHPAASFFIGALEDWQKSK